VKNYISTNLRFHDDITDQQKMSNELFEEAYNHVYFGRKEALKRLFIEQLSMKQDKIWDITQMMLICAVRNGCKEIVQLIFDFLPAERRTAEFLSFVDSQSICAFNHIKRMIEEEPVLAEHLRNKPEDFLFNIIEAEKPEILSYYLGLGCFVNLKRRTLLGAAIRTHNPKLVNVVLTAKFSPFQPEWYDTYNDDEGKWEMTESVTHYQTALKEAQRNRSEGALKIEQILHTFKDRNE